MTKTEKRKKFEGHRESKSFGFRRLFRISDFFRTSDFGFRISKWALAIMALAALAGPASAQFTRPEGNSARSLSGQFIVRSLRGRADPKPAPMATNQNLVRLEPTLVTISCERIKQYLDNELGVGTAWRGKIFLALDSRAASEQPVTILSERFKDGWQYSVELPDALERVQYVRAIVRVLLLEFANRNAGTRSAEIPVWLGEGFTQQLLAAKESEIILRPAPADANGRLSLITTSISARRDDPLSQAHNKLEGRPPLSFEELSWPAEEQWSGDLGEVYRCNAQLFLNRLLQLKDGRASLRAMLAELPQRQNWQIAFLNAFHASFQRPLDIEKWWALQLVHFTGRDLLAQTWAFEESWQKLDAALHAPVEIHAGTNEMPLHASVTLQTVIQDWDSARQANCLEAKIRELELLRPRLGREFAGLVDSYGQTLRNYLQHQHKTGLTRFFGQKAALNRAEEQALKQLDDLDTQRASVRPAQKQVTARQP